MSDDITFCGSDCDNKKCFRHPSNIAEPNIPHSFSYFKGTEDCPYSVKKTMTPEKAVERVTEVTTKITCYNCFGDKVDERVETTSSFYTFREDKETGIYKWVKGNEEDK